MVKIGKLKKVNIKEVWPKEDEDFTLWLSQEGIYLLKEELGLGDIEVLETEANVGDFKVDLLAVEETPGGSRKIIIENQYGFTDHKHLGQLLTYAAGQDANIIIWITEKVRDEHRSVVDWLNRIAESSDVDVNFFLVKVEVWKIGNSEVAPKFTVVASPNNWSKLIKKSKVRQLGETSLKSYEFLKNLVKFLSKKAYFGKINDPSPRTPSYHYFSIGVSDAWARIVVNNNKKCLKLGIYIRGRKKFENVYHERDKIHQVLGKDVEWEEYEKGGAVNYLLKGFDIKKEDMWPSYFEWVEKKLENIYRAKKLINKLVK
ncbi:DUF4268 domain-containing protein [Candidatus Micrarchaeota archaeon]|nr:DUF4268 domain-containing protein [Candidatus Micrarchaeota archaeon]